MWTDDDCPDPYRWHHVGDVLEVAKQIQIGMIYVSPGSLTVPDFVAT